MLPELAKGSPTMTLPYEALATKKNVRRHTQPCEKRLQKPLGEALSGLWPWVFFVGNEHVTMSMFAPLDRGRERLSASQTILSSLVLRLAGRTWGSG